MAFQPGVSGNPGGRPKGLTSVVRARVGDDGASLVDALLLIASGSLDDVEAAYGAKPTIRDRMAAIEQLMDRGFGKVTQTVAGDPDNPLQHRVMFGGRYKVAA